MCSAEPFCGRHGAGLLVNERRPSMDRAVAITGASATVNRGRSTGVCASQPEPPENPRLCRGMSPGALTEDN